MTEEIFDVVNENDEVIAQAPRRIVHQNGLLHRAVHVLVYNPNGRLFLQKRSLKKDCFPGAWDSSASGHLDVGETYDACALRELREELGLALPAPPEKLFKINACPQTGQEFVWIYRCVASGPFELHPDEIETGDWFAQDYIARWMRERPTDFASALLLLWNKLNEFQSRQ